MVYIYKVLEIIWLHNNGFTQKYCGTFKALEEAQNYVEKNVEKWEKDLQEYQECVATGIGIEIETWAKDNEEEDDSFEELVDTYTAWCKDKAI